MSFSRGVKTPVESNIQPVTEKVADSLNYKQHAEKGAVFHTGLSQSLERDYYGFTVSNTGAAIGSIDYGEYASLYEGDLTTIPLTPGKDYFIKFRSITLTSGEMILYKK